jgi:hypothetical protein
MEWIPITDNDRIDIDDGGTYYFTDDFCKKQGIDWATTYEMVWVTTIDGEVFLDKIDVDNYGYSFYTYGLEYITAFMWIEEPTPYKS